MRKKILLTFDYELFLGRKSGTPGKCLIDPTDRLLAIFRKHNMKGTFFIDVIYYMRLLESEATICDASKIKDQLQAIVAQGSRIELHLHPHWLDAEYINGEWRFPSYDKFRVQSLPEEKITELFRIGTQILEDIARQIDPEYKVMAFRAGGFCVQPFTLLKPGFLTNGILIDSSVAPGLAGESQTHRFDFRKVPDKAVYRFENDPNLAEDDGSFYEFPIATYSKSFAAKLKLKIWAKFLREQFRPSGDGQGLYFPIPWWRKLLPSVRMLTLDGEMLPGELVHQIEASPRQMVTLISHPKSFSEISFICIERMLDDECEFIGIDDAINMAQTLPNQACGAV